MSNLFVWADLSTFDISLAKRFYSQCFGWKYQEIGDGYVSAQLGEQPAAGLFTMPEKFQSIGMPSFWMSYIQVDEIEEVVRLAEQHGAKIEVKPQPAPGGGRVALIRDPAGAGFTCYEGDDPGGKDSSGAPGRQAWNELHVSNLATVESFYTHVFGWHIQATDVSDRYEIFLSKDRSEPIAGIQVTSNDIKGEKEYWGVYFSVSDFAKATKQIEKHGGHVEPEQPLGSQRSMLAYDNQDAAFYLLEAKHKTLTGEEKTEDQPYKWRAVLGLVIVAIAVLTEANWVWGVLFLVWIIPDIQRGSTHFLEYVERKRNPVVYWLIIATWIVLSVYLLVAAVMGI